MEVTELYIYPIKSLRPFSVPTAQLRREGLQHDRRFMLLMVDDDGSYKNIQTAYFPECTLFHQIIEGGEIIVTYRIPERPLFPPNQAQSTTLRVPLEPSIDGREVVGVKLFGSHTPTYRMGEPYDTWFSSCFGYKTILVYIGDGEREVLAHSPNDQKNTQQQERGKGREQRSWFSSITSHLGGSGGPAKQPQSRDWLAFNEAAPFLLTSKASLHDVSARLPDGEEMDMIKFRPNIVVDASGDSSSGSGGEVPPGPGHLKAWDEDLWAELEVYHGSDKQCLALTANCGRCISINIDYDTGRPAEGEVGTVLKKLMRDRRVDNGNKWSPIFGRYAFLLPSTTGQQQQRRRQEDDDDVVEIAVGDKVAVTRRITERDIWAWPKT